MFNNSIISELNASESGYNVQLLVEKYENGYYTTNPTEFLIELTESYKRVSGDRTFLDKIKRLNASNYYKTTVLGTMVMQDVVRVLTTGEKIIFDKYLVDVKLYKPTRGNNKPLKFPENYVVRELVSDEVLDIINTLGVDGAVKLLVTFVLHVERYD